MDLVENPASTGDFESLRNFHPGDPGDLAVPEEERDAIALLGGDFTINEQVFEFFR